jgi:NTP pyrophosphatase (non-canonical NTP hydrolase)|tara:strand:+ start:353 stop:733 length:381 start_codon:yes stop_codon:yes gene_type:complete
METFLQEEVNKFMKEKNKSTITASEYQRKAKETAIFPPSTALEYLTLGLVGEAGEIANKTKKVIRDRLPTENWKHDLPSEIGDVLWYCAVLADYLDYDLGKIMENNLDKLKSRKKRGVLGGSGDNR